MTGITAINRDYGDAVSIVRITTTDTLSTASAANYILNQAANIAAANSGAFTWNLSDFVLVYASNGWMFASISSNFDSLTPFAFSTDVVGTPVVVGDFAVFQSTSGNLEDLGYLPSNSAKTSVVMATGAVTVGNIAVYEDTAGTIGQNATPATNLGGIYAGASGTAGVLRSYPATASKGYLELEAVASSANYAAIISNASLGQASTWTLSDPGASTSFIAQYPAAPTTGNFPQASGTAGLLVDSGVGIANVQLTATVPLTAAQFNAMYTTPIEILSAPGSGLLTVIDKVYLEQTYVSAQFADGGAIALQYKSTAEGAGVLATTTLAAATVNGATASTVYTLGTAASIVFANAVNEPVYISNQSGVFETGDSTWNIIVYYRNIAA